MVIRPTGDNVYIEVLPMEDKKGLVYLSEVHSERTRKAVVRAIGDEVTQFKVGDKILIPYFAGAHLQLMEIDSYSKPDIHRIIKEYAIYAKYED